VVTDRLSLLHDAADAVAVVLRANREHGFSGLRPGQYVLDLRADDAALAVLRRAGVGIVSEESGVEAGTRPEWVIVDPVDGSTNASRGIPWFATSLCLVDEVGPAVALVVNQASGVRFWAERGGGAWCDGQRLGGSGCTDLAAAVVGLNGVPPRPLGSWQSRMFGAAALDLCAVAAGALDGYVDCVVEAHGVWDHAGATLICAEAGVPVVDLHGRDLVVLDHAARRTPVAAATPVLLDALLAARRTFA
jgi:fructose-1,6-bisphosphatase/inositol monophosphatase family enzyme